MSDIRKKDRNWIIYSNEQGITFSEDARLATLMDIRDELKKLNRVFECHNTLQIPQILRQIRANTSKKRKKAKR